MILKLCTVVASPEFNVLPRTFRFDDHLRAFGLVDVGQVDLEIDLDLVAVDITLLERDVLAGALPLDHLVVVLQAKDDTILVLLLSTSAVDSAIEVQAGRSVERFGGDEVEGQDEFHHVDRV